MLKKASKAILAFIIHFVLFIVIIAIILPKDVSENITGISFLIVLALSIYIAIKAYKLNTLFPIKIGESMIKIGEKLEETSNKLEEKSKRLKEKNIENKRKNENKEKLQEEIDFIRGLGNSNNSTTTSHSNSTKTNINTSYNKKPDIEIVYEKENGEISTRQIQVDEVDKKYLQGYCFLRNEDRTFRLDRIKELTDLNTNKKITNKEEIINYLQSNFKGSSATVRISIKKTSTPIDYGTEYVDDGYFNDSVKTDVIVAINKNFHIIYDDLYKFDADVIKLGKTIYDNSYFILVRNLNVDKFAGLYVNKINEMYDLTTGEVINNPIKYFDEIYEKEYEKFIEKEKKQEEKEEIDNFIEENLDLLKILIYIAKSDGSINSKEKDILIDTLKELFPEIHDPLKIIDKVAKNHLYFNSYNSFSRNAKKIIEDYPEIDFLEFAERIVSTQKNIHTDEEKILNYLSKIYNREYQSNYEPQTRSQRVTNNETCPNCGSTHTHKKGVRHYKNYSVQRYQCQDCGKIFSVKIDEKN